MRIRSISRVQNDTAAAKFNRILQSPGEEFTTVYHSTTAPIDTVVAEGLDQRLSKPGYFGRGIYFSDPIKCSIYQITNSTTKRHASIRMYKKFNTITKLILNNGTE